MNGEAVSKTASDKRYYWLKLPKDFFDRPDIRMLMGGKDGTWYIYAYIRLLCESIDTGGRLLVREDMPYSNESLRLVLRCSERRTEGLLSRLRMIGFLSEVDGCFVLNDLVDMVGSESPSAVRMRKSREEKDVHACECHTSVTKMHNVQKCDADVTQEKEIDIEKEIELERERESEKEKDAAAQPTARAHARAPQREGLPTEGVPSLAEVEAYVRERGYGFSAAHFFSYYAARGWRLHGVTVADWQALADSWQTRPQGEEGRAPPGQERFGTFDHEEAFRRALTRSFLPLGGESRAGADGK